MTATTLTVTDITASFAGRHAFQSYLSKASSFIEVQASGGGGSAHTNAALEHAYGRSAACALGPVKLERAGSHLVIKVMARAAEPAVLPATPPSPVETIALARISAAPPIGSHGVQTATLVDAEGRVAGQVTCTVEDTSDDEASPDSPSSTASSSSRVGERIKAALETAAEKTLKVASCMWTAPAVAYTDPEAVYRHQDAFCAAFGTYPVPMTGTSFMRV